MSIKQQVTYSLSWGPEYTGWAAAPKTLVEMLERAAAGGKGIVHVKADGSETYQPYAEMLSSAQRVLGALRARGFEPGDKVIVEVQESSLFLPVFWGCVLGGFIPVPMHTPASFDPDSNEMRKTKNVWMLLDEPLLVCDGFIEDKYFALKQHHLFSDLRLATAEELLEHEADHRHYAPSPTDVAFLQFSSGSTGDAKGVQLTHENLIFNCGGMEQCFEHTDEEVFVSWMPLYHDMGLIAFHLTGVFVGAKQVRMSHETFLRRPELLLRKISEHRGTLTGSPNFGLEWMTTKIRDLSSLDLSSLRIIYNGAEPISIQVKEAFEEKFAACGLKNVMHYVYGMAETCVGATGMTYGEQGDLFHRIDQQLLNRQGIAVPVSDPDVPHLLIADEGIPFPGMGVRIVDDNDQLVQESQIGHIQIKGLNVTPGYYRNPEANANLFCEGEWLRTGDLGFMVNGRLAVTGRTKDVIFINGQNFYAHDIEDVLISAFDLPNQTVVAVGLTDQKNSRERVYIFVKFKRVNDQFLKLAQDMKTLINVEMGFEIDGVVPVRAIPKTTSGKLERYNLRNRLIEGEFDELLEDIRLQLIEKSSSRNDLIQPRTETEKTLHKIWNGIFVNVPESAISVTDHFMALGGNSLKAMQMVRELEETFGIEQFDLIQLFENATIEKLATYVEALQAQGTGEKVAPKQTIRDMMLRLNAGDEKKEHELSRGQSGLWFIQKMNPQSVAYNEHYRLKISGALDVKKFEQTLRTIIERHATLRTVFAERDGHPKQVVLDQVAFELPLLEAGDAEAAFREDLTTPFDLAKGPLFRFKLYKAGEQEFYFYMVTHHIVIDGLSTDVLFREMSAIYSGNVHGLPPLDVQYADFADWQREQLDSPKFRKMEEYWVNRLAKPLPVLELPIDFPRPPQNSDQGATVNYPLPDTLTQQLLQVCEKTNASLFMVMLSAYFIWLNRMTNEEDIIVGTPFTARTEPDVQNLIGYFVNTMPIRVGMEGAVTFHDVLNRVRVHLLEAMANQEYPFDLLVETVNPERDPSRPILQSTLFDFQIPPTAKMDGLELELMDSRKISSISDLTWNVLQKQDHLHLDVVYNMTLFQPETIQRFVGQYENILQAIVQDVEAPIHLVPILTEQERNQLLTEWNDTSKEYPQDTCLHQLFEAQVEKTPDRIALTFEGQHLTYRELNEWANRVAHRLQKLGAGPEVLVGLMLERSLEVVVGILAILKAGGAYLPLDPSYPPERLAFMLEDSEIPVLLTQEPFLAELSVHQAQVLCFDRDHAEIEAEPATNPSSAVGADNLAYVIYTSGSTGKPKGVLIQHANVTRLFEGTAEWYGFNEGDVWTLFHSYAFDFSVWEIWGALLYGGRLVVVPHLVSREPLEFHRLLSEEGVTVLNQTPSAFYQLMQADERSQGNGELALRYVIFGGEALELQYLKSWFQRHGDQQPQLVNMYGITETTVHVTYRPIRLEDVEKATGSVIGIPIPDLQLYVLDQHLQPVPYGVTGEMYVGGAGVARGYLKRPDLTAERFIDDPFRPDHKLYKSGDLARLLANGELEYKGRIDHQVKIRGFRIELGEIESQLLQIPSIREAVVLVREDVPGDQRLTAYLVLEGEQPEDVKEWQSHLRERLPSYMVPSAFVVMASMPLTNNGKVDRKALPKPDSFASHEEEFAPPRTALEEVVAGVWADVLRMEKVGIYDDFFEAGGHSLLATQMIARLSEACSVQVPLKALFEAPNVAGLAAQIELLQAEQEAVELLPLQRASRDEALPLSYSQLNLWLLDRLMSNRSSYNMPGAMRLQGTLHADALKRSIREIVARHEALRTAFAEVDGQPVQVISDAPVVVETIDLSAWPTEEREEQLDRLMQKEAQHVFDLAVGPLVRFSLVRLAEDQHALLMNFHHIIFDGWSLDVLINELVQLYTAFAAGEESPLAPLPIQYADYSVWQRKWLEDGLMSQQLEYWKGKLASLPVLELPTDRPRPPVQTQNGRLQRFELSQELTEALQALSQQQGATLYMTLMAAFQTLLARCSGQEDIVVGTPIAGRQRREVEELIGFFLNTLVIRTDLSGEPSFRDVLNRVRVTAQEAYAHQDAPFEKLIEELQPERDMSRSPLFQVLFIMQNMALEQMKFADLDVSLVEAEVQSAKYDLTLNMKEQGGVLYGSFEYNTDLFDASTMERMVGHFRNLLEGIAANPDLPIRHVEILTEQDHAAYEQLNDTGADYDLDHLLIDAFVEQAEAHPERVALVCEGRTMTYGELHERSNRLAHFLRAQGVQRNQLVAIMMERSIEMMVGLYGILKSGGAYVPIDPLYPPERIQYMLADSEAHVLLTKQEYLDVMPDVSTVLLVEEELTAAPEEVPQAVIWRDLADLPTTMPEPVNVPSDLAYMIYTSGSTGQPKGVLIQHTAILNRMHWHQDTFGCTPDDVVIQRTTVCFDDSVIELFWPLRHGATLSIMSQDVVLDPKQMIEQLNRDGATYMQFVPSLLSVVVTAMAELPAEQRPNLRAIIVSGEALPTNLVQQWFDLFPGTRMANLYGPTEAAVDVTGAIYEAPTTPITIGTPTANTQIYVLDANGQLCPVNVKGELYVGGVQLAVGYHNKPDKTAEAFVPNHLTGTPGDRLYRTGDAVRLLPNGNIEYLGRNDDQVKIRGMRIELGEIESALVQHESVREAVVLVHEVEGDKSLSAYLVLDGESSADASLWQAYLRERVPAYMVPSAYMVLEAMPLTPNGKVDRKALPKPDASSFQQEYVPPRTALEEIVAAVWADVLGRERIGAHDNFFEAGGHSLLATQVMSRLAGSCSVQVPLKVLFETPTVAALADVIERLQQEQQADQLIPLVRVSRDEPLPLSFAQQRLWVVDRLLSEGAKASYNLPGAMRLQGTLHVEALERSLNEILARHEVLRTTFAEVNGEPVQVIAESWNVLETIDLRAWTEAAREEEVNRLIYEEGQRLFDLAVGPLVRYLLVQVQDEEHVLIANYHHIIFDGWSINVLMEELGQLYAAFTAGEGSPLAPLPIQYADYAVWQRNWLEGGVMERQLAYWNRKLADLPVLQLPTDRPRPLVQTYNGRTERFELTNELTDALQELSQEQGATLYMTLLGAFQTLLARYSGQDDIVIGTPIAGRQHRELEELVGFFVNTLVMRTNLSGAPSFREVLNRVRETALEAYAHQDVPFEKLVEELHPERDMSRSPLYQVMFTLQNTPTDLRAFADLNASIVETESHVAKYDLILTLTEQAGGLYGRIEYNTDLFDQATMERMAGHFRTLLEGIVANPELAIDQLPLLTEPERHQLLNEWNDTGADYPQDVLVNQFVEAQAEKTPDSIAVRFEGQSLTYRELNEQANRVAHRLQKLGVGPDVFVGLMVERSLEMAIGILAIVKAGGAYVPLDPAYPSDRLAHMMEDAQVPVLLTQESLLAQLPAHQAQVLCFDRDRAEIEAEPATNPVSEATVENLIYVIFTSGSTGRPKGVQIEHRALVNYLFATNEYMKVSASDVMVAVFSMSFDPAASDLFLPLFNGSTCVIATRETMTDGVQLGALIDSSEATVMMATPATWGMLVQSGWKGRSELRVFCGGEAFPRELINTLIDTTQEVWNIYGPTESTILCTMSQMEKGNGTILIGGPFNNTTAYILDEHMQPMPIGVAGEIYVGGRQLARGYLNRPDLTAASFLPNPFPGFEGERIYKTGDLGRFHANGEIEPLGRIDGQVKVRGFRIELGEIETVLSQHESVQEAVVVVHDVAGDKRLVAYLVLDAMASADATEWKAFLRERVPAFMVPSAFVVLDTMPLTPNRKVDRKALPMPDFFGTGAEEYVAPRTEMEQTVAEIWADVLQMDRVGVNDNFFEAGGHSLLATQVMSRLTAAYAVKVPLKALFEAPTVGELASYIEDLQQELLRDEQLPIERISRERPLPLSFAQQRLWVLDRFMGEGADASYNVSGAMRLQGSLNVEALEQALQTIIDRHEVLRTTFAEVDGEPVQVIADASVVLDKVDLRTWPSEAREEQVQRLLQEEALRPFDLAVGPLVRFSLVQVRDDEHVLIANYHHIIFDGWSLDVVSDELVQLYTAFVAGEESPLEPLPIQYADYAVWQRNWLEGDVMNGQLAYWQEKLADLPVLQLPTDHPRPPVQTYSGRMARFELSNELTDALHALSQEQGATLYMTLLGAFQTLLVRYSGQEDIVVGTPIAGRQRPEIERLIGFFVNTLVMRTDLSGEPTFREVLNRVRETALSAYANQDVPFEKLVEELQPERDMSRTPLFQVVFVLQNMPLDEPEFADLKVNMIEAESEVAKFDLTVSLREQSGRLYGGIEYNTDLFDAETIDRMAGHFRTLLEGIVSNPETPIHLLPLLTQQEQHQLLTEWNDTGADYPLDVNLAQLFEAQVEKTPDKIAIRFEDAHLTYRELNERANQLAHYLRRLGVGPEVMVGASVDRSLEMAVALYGIQKAGGVYVPIDPSYPSDRITSTLEDAQAAVLLSKQHLVLPEHGAKVVYLDSDWEQIAGESKENPTSVTTRTNLAYTIYTSGSTGKPKGALIEHAALTNAVFSHQSYMNLGASDVVVSVTSVSFDPAVLDLCLPLVNGATVVIAPRETVTDGVQLAELFESVNATIVQATAATWNMLMQAGWKGNPSLRVICGGEALSRELIAELSEYVQEIWNVYGPTETTIVTTAALMDPSQETVLVGQPLANYTTYIFDKHMQPVPVGVVGEVYIGGIGLARGYLNRPELNERAFLNHQGERLYKTGDLARYHKNGQIEIIGRADSQVKIRGFRIELGEIESVLMQHDAIREAAVVVHVLSATDKRLTAYVVLDGEEDVTVWKAYLRERLPSYMVPSAFVVLESMPISPNGKLDRRGLPMPDWSQLRSEDYVAPRTTMEETIAAIWGDVLRMENISVYDNFFEVGGHSLLATQVISRLSGAFSLQVPLKTLFEAPTVAELATQIERLQQQQGGVEIIPLERVSRAEPLPLSFAQQRLWVVDRLLNGGATYNTPAAMRVQGILNAKALEQALLEIIARHEVLRTTFAEVDGEPIQVIADSSAAVEKIDLRTLPEEEREEQVTRLFQEEAQRPFDLAVGPLVRFSLVSLADDQHVLMSNFHHIISDGWSMEVLYQELAQLYTAFAAGEQSPLAPLPIQYGDYAVWQRKWLHGDILNRQLAYWNHKLADLPVLQLPTDHLRPPVQTYNGRVERFELTKELTEALQALSQQQGATLYMTLLGAFQTLLARYSGQEDIVVGTPIAGRQRREIEELIGFFVNMLVMRTDLTGSPNFREVITRVRETALEAYANQDVPFEKLVEELQPERDMSRSPLFQVMFVLQNIPMDGPQFADLLVSQIEPEIQVSKYDIGLSMWEQSGVLCGGIEYNTDLFDAATIQRMSGHFRTLLESIAANPEMSIHQLPILTEQEQHQLLSEWVGTRETYPQDVCVPQLFEAQVEKTPDSIAVVVDGKHMTYRELNDRANRVAHYLRTLGVVPEMKVGLMLERSLELVVAVYGILKAGAAYVPIDTTYPPDRIAFILQDAGISLLLTQQHLVSTLPEHGAKIICLDSDWDKMAGESTDNPAPVNNWSHLAYTIYTSGSTGKPKGVQIQHGSWTNFLFASKEFVPMQATDVVMCVASISFDPTVLDLFLPLIHGGKVVIASRETATDGAELAALLETWNATVMQATPATWYMLLQAGWTGSPQLRAINCGEAISRELINELVPRTKELWNAYGPTEATLYTTTARMEAGRGTVLIGRPLANYKTYILDKHLQPVPVGMVGELYIGGRGLGRGYLNRPELTSAAFLPHPFAGEEGERLYKTGDLARYHANGQLECLGRVDSQVKLRGFRIELGEIESVLMQLDSIKEAVALVQEVAAGDKRLIAYLVLEGEQDVQAWKSYLRDRLPSYMVPNAFVVLDAMPLTPNGKVDRKTLGARRDFLVESGAERLAPRDTLEQRLMEIWERLLGVREFGIRDNFFELGGHSLLAVRLMADVQKEFAAKLPLTSLYQEGTIENLAGLLRRHAGTDDRVALVPVLLSESDQKPLFLVHPLFGVVQPYIELARLLGGRSVYGLQSKGIYDDHEPLATIEEMAAFYIEEIRSVQPEGPYLLAGWSLGGVIATEMALQLQRQGERISYLGLLDSMLLAPNGESSFSEQSTREAFRDGMLDLLGEGFAREELPSGIDTMEVEAEVEWFVERAKSLGVLPSGLDAKQLAKMYRVLRNNYKANQNYQPSGKVEHLFLYQAREQEHEVSTIPWSEVAERIDILDVPGSHQTIVKMPHVTDLAENMRRDLDRQ